MAQSVRSVLKLTAERKGTQTGGAEDKVALHYFVSSFLTNSAMRLASPLASYIVGQTLVVDGGLIL